MSQVDPLDRVIRRVETPDPPLEDSRGEVVVIVDARQGKERVLEQAPFWKLGLDLRYFVVSSIASAECEGPTCLVSDLATGRSIELLIRYEAQCVPGRAKLLALELGTHDDPHLHLNGLLETWVGEFMKAHKRGGEDVIGGFYRVKPSLERHLGERARSIGLELDAVVALVGEDEVKPVEIEIDGLPVKLAGYDGEVLLHLSAELDIHPEKKIQAVLRRGKASELEEKVREATRSFMLERVSVHDFHFNLAEGIHDLLKATLDDLLAKEGRLVTHLVLEPVGLPAVEQNLTHDYKVHCRIKDPPTEVELQNSLLLDLEDLGRWQRSGFEDLEDWCDRVLAPIAREQLFDKSYIDLLLDFSETEATIKALVRQKASQVGYSVHHHVVLPALAPLELPKGFDLKVGGEFATQDSRIKVGLNAVVHGSIPDLRKIQQHLRPGVDVKEKIERTVYDVTERVMHGIHPERFYMRFLHTDVEGELPVEEEIREAIRRELETSFAVHEPRIILKLTDTPLTNRITGLCKGFHSLEFSCTALPGGGADEEVPFVVQFEVLGVQDWFTFYSKGYESLEEEVDAIRKILAEALKADLGTVMQEQLQYRDIEGKVIISQHIFTRALERVNEVFGLMIRIITMRRELSVQEQVLRSLHAAYAGKYAKAEIEGLGKKLGRRLDEYDRLVERLADFQSTGFDAADPEIVQLREQIADLESEITQKAPEFGPKLITEARNGKRVAVEWGAYSDQPTLITAGKGPVEDRPESGDE